jgi:hypothetical protein
MVPSEVTKSGIRLPIAAFFMSEFLLDNCGKDVTNEAAFLNAWRI